MDGPTVIVHTVKAAAKSLIIGVGMAIRTGQNEGTMEIKFGEGTTEYGPGVAIEMTGSEVALAIFAWLVAHDIHISGARTVTVNGELCEDGRVYVDPSGSVVVGGKRYLGRGGIEP